MRAADVVSDLGRLGDERVEEALHLRRFAQRLLVVQGLRVQSCKERRNAEGLTNQSKGHNRHRNRLMTCLLRVTDFGIPKWTLTCWMTIGIQLICNFGALYMSELSEIRTYRRYEKTSSSLCNNSPWQKHFPTSKKHKKLAS